MFRTKREIAQIREILNFFISEISRAINNHRVFDKILGVRPNISIKPDLFCLVLFWDKARNKKDLYILDYWSESYKMETPLSLTWLNFACDKMYQYA